MERLIVSHLAFAIILTMIITALENARRQKIYDKLPLSAKGRSIVTINRVNVLKVFLGSFFWVVVVLYIIIYALINIISGCVDKKKEIKKE